MTGTHVIVVPVRLFQDQQTGRWVAHCLGLDVASSGPTVEEAIRRTREAVELFVESCAHRHVLEEVLLESGFLPEPSSDHELEAPAINLQFQTDPLPLAC